MSQLPILLEDFSLEQYDRVEAVFTTGIKAINALTGLIRWELMETLNKALDRRTPTDQWFEMSVVLDRAEKIAIGQQNVQALVKFDQLREVANHG